MNIVKEWLSWSIHQKYSPTMGLVEEEAGFSERACPLSDDEAKRKEQVKIEETGEGTPMITFRVSREETDERELEPNGTS